MSDLTRAIAEVRFRQYESEYSASHLTWEDFTADADEIAAALAPLIEARVREARAEAWDEGYAKGFYRAQAIHNDDPDRERDASEFDDPNPFDEEVRNA